MYNNGDNQMMQNGQNTYTTYEEVNSNYPRGGFSSADSLEQELFYGSGAQGGAKGAYQQQQMRSATVYAEPEQYSKSYQNMNADQLPSETTRQFIEEELNKNPYQDYREEGETANSRRYKISTKGKVIAAVYAIVIASILALIVLNTRLLKNMDSQIAFQQAEINALMERNQELGETYDYVRSNEVIEQKAQDLGMIHD